MSRYAHAVTLKTWNARHSDTAKARKRAKAPPARKPTRREAPRRAPKPRHESLPDVVYDDPPPEDDEDLEGWDDIDAIPDVDDDVGDAPRKRQGVVARLRDVLAGRWGKPARLGPNLQVRARDGFRAAVVEVKPGLFVVAEVPQTAVEFGFGPLLLAPALVKTLAKALNKRQHAQGLQPPQIPPPAPQLPPAPPLALPGPTRDDDEDDDRTDGRLPRWVDGEVAEELGCAWKKGGRR